jgi:hypothetical protein
MMGHDASEEYSKIDDGVFYSPKKGSVIMETENGGTLIPASHYKGDLPEDDQLITDGGQVYSTEGTFQVDDPDKFVEHFFENAEEVSTENWAGVHLGTATRQYDWNGLKLEVDHDGTVRYEGDATSVALLEGVVNSYDGAENVSFYEAVAADGGTKMTDVTQEAPVEGYDGQEGPNGAPL